MFLATTTGDVLIRDFQRIRPIEVLRFAESTRTGEDGSLIAFAGNFNSPEKTHRGQAANYQDPCQRKWSKPQGTRSELSTYSKPSENTQNTDIGGAAHQEWQRFGEGSC